METVKIVFDVDSKDIKSTTDELKALNKVTNDEVAAMQRLSNSASDAGDGFVSLRTRVKEAKEEAVKAAEKYGEFSREALAAKTKAGELADQMGDLNRQVNLLNPEAKAKAFSNLAQGVVGAFSVATGALQAFGVKNKEVEALAMKLQGALNITQGIASIGQLKESFSDLQVILGFTTATQKGLTVAQKEQAIASAMAALGTTELTAAQEAEAIAAAEAELATKGFTAALLTNPIFLAVAAIAALAGAMMYLSKDTDESAEKVDELKKAEETLTKSLQTQRTSWIDLQVAQGKLSKTQGEILKNNDEYNIKVKETNAVIEENKKKIKENASSYIFWGKVIDVVIKGVAGLIGWIPGIGDALKEKLLGGFLESNKQIELANKELTESLKVENQTRQNNNEIANTENLNSQKELNKQKAKEREQEAQRLKAEAEKQWQEEYKLKKAKQQNEIDEAKTQEEKLALQQKYALLNYSYEKQHLEETGATVTQLDQLWQDYYKTRLGLSAAQDKAFQDSCDKQLKAQEDLIKKLNDASTKNEADPIKKLQDETDAMEALYVEQYNLAVKNGDDTTQLTEAFFKYQESQRQKMAAEDKKNGDKQIAERKKTAEQEAQDRIDTAKFAISAIGQLNQSFSDLQKSQADAEIADVQALYDKKLISEKAYNEKIKQIKKKQWEADKRAQIIQATIGIANGIINALSTQPANLVPYAIGLASTVGALQLATIIATKPPQFAKGTLSVPGIDMGKDSVHAILQPGEAVIPTKTNRAYHPTIKAIYEKKISPSEINNFVMSRTKSGGSSAITANVDTYALTRALGKNKTVEVGNANVIGRAMARELLRGQNYRRA